MTQLPADAPRSLESRHTLDGIDLIVRRHDTRRSRPARPHEMIRDQARGRPMQPRREEHEIAWRVDTPGSPRPRALAEIQIAANGLYRVRPVGAVRLRPSHHRQFDAALQAIARAVAST